MDHPVIIFDSGIGGLSILKELIFLKYPIVYFADQANFPYGEKTSTWLENRLVELSHHFESLSPVAVVLACNTASTIAITKVRDILKCPVVGVEPVIKPATSFKNAVVWATPATLNSSRANDLKQLHGPHVKFYSPRNLASAIEFNNLEQIKESLSLARAELGVVDAIGLSCTHYPLIKSQIHDFFPEAQIIDPSPSVAKQVLKVLGITKYPSQASKTRVSYETSANLVELSNIAKKYL